MQTLATIIDGEALWQTVLASFGAGLWVTLFFSIAVLGAAQVVELGREGRRTAAAIFGLVSALAVAACLAAIVVGIIVMTTK